MKFFFVVFFFFLNKKLPYSNRLVEPPSNYMWVDSDFVSLRVRAVVVTLPKSAETPHALAANYVAALRRKSFIGSSRQTFFSRSGSLLGTRFGDVQGFYLPLPSFAQLPLHFLLFFPPRAAGGEGWWAKECVSPEIGQINNFEERRRRAPSRLEVKWPAKRKGRDQAHDARRKGTASQRTTLNSH